MASYVDSGRLPGALTLIARGGQVAFVDAVGYRDVEARVPLTEDALHRFYSMTKPITSVAAMMLYEEGAFHLDDPLEQFIPDFADMQVYVSGERDDMTTEPARAPITIANLLTHTAGLTYGFINNDPLARLYRKSKTDFFPIRRATGLDGRTSSSVAACAPPGRTVELRRGD